MPPLNRFAPCLLLFAGCATATPSTPSSRSSSAPSASASATLPDFTLETVDGERFVLSEHVGKKVIVMSFWATWCNPCMSELPHLDEIYQSEKDNGLLILAIAMDEPGTVAQVAPTASRLGLTMPVVLDTDQRAVRLYNRSRDAPRTVVIDRSGTIVRSSAGYNPGDEEKLRAEVQALLAQPSP
ncbi:MAG: TlpA disulfide reductase family protein [Myxococcota bacterium]